LGTREIATHVLKRFGEDSNNWRAQARADLLKAQSTGDEKPLMRALLLNHSVFHTQPTLLNEFEKGNPGVLELGRALVEREKASAVVEKLNEQLKL
jgi:hypothetical protein